MIDSFSLLSLPFLTTCPSLLASLAFFFFGFSLKVACTWAFRSRRPCSFCQRHIKQVKWISFPFRSSSFNTHHIVQFILLTLRFDQDFFQIPADTSFVTVLHLGASLPIPLSISRTAFHVAEWLPLSYFPLSVLPSCQLSIMFSAVTLAMSLPDGQRSPRPICFLWVGCDTLVRLLRFG